MQINNQTMKPRYEWPVDYIDAMCFSNTYTPQIPTAEKKELKDISNEAQNTIANFSRMRKELLESEHISPMGRDWHYEVFWKLDNNALYYCKKDFKI